MSSAGGARIRAVDADEAVRRRARADPALRGLWDILDTVADPELPMLSIWEIGILRSVERVPDGAVRVRITPTYSACPAIAAIAEDIAAALRRRGHADVRVETRLSPAWRSAWLSAGARRKLAAHGIAPPGDGEPASAAADGAVRCVRCGSADTECVSAFGATACQAVHRCRTCRETFPRFKTL